MAVFFPILKSNEIYQGSTVVHNFPPNDVQKVPGFGIFFQRLNIDDSTHFLFFFTVLFCIFIILSTFFRLFNLRYIIKLTANLEIELSKLIFKNNIFQSYIDYTKRNSSEVITITIDKVSSTASALRSFFNLIGSSILSLFILGSLLLINWKIVFYGIVYLLVYYLLTYKKVRKKLSEHGILLASLGPRRLRLLQEVFFGFRDVIVNGTQKIYIDIFNKIDIDIKTRDANAAFISIFPRYLIEGVVISTLVIVGFNLSQFNFNLIS